MRIRCPPSRAPRAPEAGFTLIEIMAVVLIIGLLGTVVGVAVFQRVDIARATTAKTQIKRLEGALETYRMDNARYPTTEQGLRALVDAPTSEPAPRNYPPGGYLNGALPRDPWGEPYQYESPGSHNSHTFDLWSYGADGQPGGEGPDADVGNWAEQETAGS